MDPNPSERSVKPEENIEARVKELARLLHDDLTEALDSYQEKYGDHAGLPGQVEDTLRERWNKFTAEKGLPTVNPPTAGITQEGEGNPDGNSFGFWLENPEREGIPIYKNFLNPKPPRYADRVDYKNIEKVIRKILTGSK